MKVLWLCLKKGDEYNELLTGLSMMTLARMLSQLIELEELKLDITEWRMGGDLEFIEIHKSISLLKNLTILNLQYYNSEVYDQNDGTTDKTLLSLVDMIGRIRNL
jgi:hypothetical protein